MEVPTAGIVTKVGTKVPMMLPTVLNAPKVPTVCPLDFGGRSQERAHANDAGADVFSPKDAVIRPGDICKLPLGFGCQS